MIKITLLSILFVLGCCSDKHKPNVQKVDISSKKNVFNKISADTLEVDMTQSKILWKGTKMRGAGKHEGTVQLKDAYILIEGEMIVGGKFTVDLRTIEVTDIPEHETVPRNRLKDHLKSTDFFDVKSYPFAHFEISQVIPLTSDSIKVMGNLAIKGITKAIEFSAWRSEKIFKTKFTFDRFQWDIAYKGSWVDKTLVDKEIQLKIKLMTQPFI